MVSPREPEFVVAAPARSVLDSHAIVLNRIGHLQKLLLGTRRGVHSVPTERTRLLPIFGLLNYISTICFSTYRSESFRFSMHPMFDRWAKCHLRPGDHVLSSYGYANECFKFARTHGGKTFVDAGNSHPENFWNILSEENRRWNCRLPPIAPQQYRRGLEMMKHSDFIMAPSSFVATSFLNRGFRPEQILNLPYPVDLSRFMPAPESRPRNRPLTIINTGQLSLRKGTPYLLEAFRTIHQRHPSTRFLLTRNVHENVKAILARYQDLPIDWSPNLSHDRLSQRLQSADIFVLPSIEEGLARTALEAMACGLPVILTPNTGVNDFVEPGRSGDVVPIRDARAIVDAVIRWGERVMSGDSPPQRLIDANTLSFETFEAAFLRHLRQLGLVS